ncbi:MAG: LysR substrate-binding domain-containing protein [Pseudanabaenaceae cyanobacterium SKYGB_i_bin29]|nr:LysR substrate-binding domain-containing protein [Pseudanabaenaceae cyanobacterium SKYGB_i_bin29]
MAPYSEGQILHHATLHQLQVFEVAARHRSFTRAAEELFLTQPTVSMQIKQLSKAVGLPLFEQVGKRLFLTDAGEDLYATCNRIFEELAEFEMKVADMKGMKQGRLKLGVVTTANYVIPRLLGPFCHRYPGIQVSLNVTNHDRLVDRIQENRDDLYIMSHVPPQLELQSYHFIENPLVVLAHRDHPLVKERNIPLERLAQESFIMREAGSYTRRSVQKLFDQYGLTINIKMEFDSNEAIKQAMAGGMGVSVLSLHTLALEGASGQLAILDVEHFPIQNQWYVCHIAGKQISVIAQTFLQFLQTEGRKIAQQTLAATRGEELVTANAS